MRFPAAALVALLLSAGAAACATTSAFPPAGGVLDARNGHAAGWDDMIDDLAGVRVVYVGESHTNPEHHAIQRRILEALSERRPHLVVGLEMLQAPYQDVLDRWTAGELDETAFLREVNWYGQWSNWSLYGPLLRLARDRRMKVVGLHLPGLGPGGVISREISRVGLENIPPWMRARLPAEIDTGSKAHQKSIREVFGRHPGMEMDEERFQRFYQSQCSWDETFAENASRALREAPPDAALVVIAGGMHVKDFVAVPERVRRRNGLDYRVVLPLESDDVPEGGVRLGMGRPADYVIATAPSAVPAEPRLGVVLRGGDTLVREALPGGAAAAAGIQAGDILVSVAGAPVVDTVDIRLVLEGRRAGEKVKLRWTREGTAMEGEGTLAAPPPLLPPPAPKDAKPAEKEAAPRK